MISNGSAGTATNLAPGGTTIVNMNIQLTWLNVRTVLEEIAGAIEAKDKAEGANFQGEDREVGGKSGYQTVLEAALGAVLKRYAS